MQLPPLDQWVLIDIETVSQYREHALMPQDWQHLWNEKVAWMVEDGRKPDSYYSERAAIMAEFGKVICISVGYFRREGEQLQLRLKSFAQDNEADLLGAFADAIGQIISARKSKIWFCGHNIREFDIPYLCRRMLIHQMTLPAWLDFQALKPWDVPLIDTLQLWKFGDYKHYTSLKLLAACMGIASPKSDIDGSMVGTVYWEEKNLERIREYCQKDVVTVAQLMLRFCNRPLLSETDIVVV